MFPAAFWVERGGLVSYGPDLYATGRQSARLVDKILKGVDPGEIPVEVNPTIEFAINLKVAKALGIAIAPEILYQADRLVRWAPRITGKGSDHGDGKLGRRCPLEKGDSEMGMLPRHMRSLWLLCVLLVSALGDASIVMSLEVGEQAPDFTLPSTTGEQISLSQFQGKKLVLIEFHVSDFGATWTKNVAAREADYSTFQELNVQVLGISANTAFSQKTFADSLKLEHPLLSDHPDLQVIRRYGVLQHLGFEPSRLAARRAFFLIDQEGIVRGRWLPEKQAELFPSAPILERVREITGKR
jgi:peroxiredoxin